MLGLKHSAETKAKMSASQKGNSYRFKKGHIVSIETRKKISAAVSGKGHKQTDETRRKISATLKGRRHSREHTEKSAAARRGEKSYRWKGGKTIIRGYVYLKRPDHPLSNNRGYVAEHRLVMEECLGRLLYPEEVVHHINGITDDNRKENLGLFKDHGQHTAFHRNEEEHVL